MAEGFTAFEHLTIADVLRHRAATDPDRPFLTYHDPLDPGAGHTLGYAECATEVKALQAVLRDVGVRDGDRVVLHMENSWQFVVALLAIVGLDAVAVPTIVQYTADEFGYVVEHSECSAIVTSARHEPMASRVARVARTPSVPVVLAATVPTGHWRVDGAAGHPRTNGTAGRRPTTPTGLPARMPTKLPDGDGLPGRRVAVMMYTSGTTGRPKGVMLSHAACLAAGATTRNETGLRPDDRSYCVLPLFHVNAMCFQLMPTLLTGSHLVLGPVFSARNYWTVVAEHGITVGNLTAGPVRILLDAPAGPAEAGNPMRLMMYALPLDGEELRAARERFGVELSMGWGLTESAACGTRTPGYLDPRHDWQSIGTVSPGWRMRVVDDTGADVEPGAVGELLLEGPSTMSGYFKNPTATADVLQGGWLRTGDLGRVESTGHVFFHDRLKDVVKVKGENVGAGEVERVLLEHPQVDDCAAVGAPDPILGERLVVYVVPAHGAVLDEQELRDHCAGRLASFKVPARVVSVSSLPRTSIGKVRKAELRERARSLGTPA